MRCLLKPIHWNPAGYTAPAGHPCASGYPHDYGYGHEEWNNSPHLRFEIDGRGHRLLHAPMAGKVVPENTLLIMYASHDRRQQMVGIAGGARQLGPDDGGLIDAIRRMVAARALWREAWAQPLVRKCHSSEAAFRKHWEDSGGLDANWICPESAFLWLDEPVDIDPQAVTGKRCLQRRFGGFTTIPADRAAHLLDTIPPGQRNAAWHTLRESLAGESDTAGRQDVRPTPPPDETTQQALIDARLGQEGFRAELLRLGQGRCALTGCAIEPVLRASHIRPWRDADDESRLDPNNGLLLAAHADALFDRYLISFDDEGRLLLANSLSEFDLTALGLRAHMRIRLRPEQRAYMAHHRQEFEARNPAPDKPGPGA